MEGAVDSQCSTVELGEMLETADTRDDTCSTGAGGRWMLMICVLRMRPLSVALSLCGAVEVVVKEQ